MTTEHSIGSAHPAAHRGTSTLKDTVWVEAATRRKGKAKSKAPRFHKPKAWATPTLLAELGYATRQSSRATRPPVGRLNLRGTNPSTPFHRASHCDACR